MNRAAPLLLTVALLAGCAQGDPPAPAAPAAQSDPSRGGARPGVWIRAESEHKDLPIAWELRDDYVAPAGAQRRLLIVSQVRDVPYVGQTDATQRPEFFVREQHLLEGLAGHADLVAVLDWRQQHDWYFYVDAEVTRERVAAALADAAGRTIRVDFDTEGGEFYKTLKQRTSGKPAQ